MIGFLSKLVHPLVYSFSVRLPVGRIDSSFSVNLLARVAADWKKGCRPAGQIFVVITPGKGLFLLQSPNNRIRTSIGAQADFRSMLL